MTMEYIQVQTTVESSENAEEIAKAVVESRLAACVQIIGPVKSKYWWKDNIVEGNEYLLLIKSRKDLYDALEKVIVETHSYDTPEVISLPVMEGYGDYLRWIVTETEERGL